MLERTGNRMKKRIFNRTLICVFAALFVAGLLMANNAFLKKKIKLNKASATLKVGSKLKLKVKNTKKKVTWKSSKKKVATVSKKGVVTAKKTGKTTITAKVGKKKLTCKIKVVKAGSSTSSKTPKATATPKPGTTSKPSGTQKPSTKPTATPKDSLANQPTANPSTRDDGWVPGWY